MAIVMYIVLKLLISYHIYINNIIINYGKLLTIEISECNAFNSLKHKKYDLWRWESSISIAQ